MAEIDGGADAIGGGRMNIEVDVGGGGAIGGLIVSFSRIGVVVVAEGVVSLLTLAANVCDTTVVVAMDEAETADLGGALLLVIIMALVYDIVVFVLLTGTDELELADVTVVVVKA